MAIGERSMAVAIGEASWRSARDQWQWQEIKGGKRFNGFAGLMI